ncbi:hypothetical protein JTE90_028734 [Oedothorax gibbosus]|uniref:Uncharacterized protein n=1 Tax=Oedothorax gibbosus TaxID=931172 RepID=A0AAV6UFF0_9ARAC|nr:hypothetical protein JTE90_028734 [Oedothorax gibbosus]
MQVIKPIFNALSRPQLLDGCLGANTQNSNESLNQLIWKLKKKKVRWRKSVTLANFGSNDKVYLQTLSVNINLNGKKQTVRALIDTSYILKATADRTGYISSRDDNYFYQVKLLGQPKICGFVESVPPGPWMKEILQKGIHISDLKRNSSFNVYIYSKETRKILQPVWTTSCSQTDAQPTSKDVEPANESDE